MAEIIKETVTTQGNNSNLGVNTPVKKEATILQTVEYLIYFIFGTLEILLAFRLVLKLAGANIASAFVGLIYGITGIFILPFEIVRLMIFAVCWALFRGLDKIAAIFLVFKKTPAFFASFLPFGLRGKGR